MSKYVWIAAAALIAFSVGILFWADRGSEEPKRHVAAPMTPVVPIRTVDGGRPWRPHPDRAGLLRHRLSD